MYFVVLSQFPLAGYVFVFVGGRVGWGQMVSGYTAKLYRLNVSFACVPLVILTYFVIILVYSDVRIHIDGHESKPANSNFSIFFLFDKFEGNTFLHNVLKNLVPSMSLYSSFRQLSKPAISLRDTFQRNKTG